MKRIGSILLSLQMSGDDLFDAGGCGVHYGTGEKIWHSDGRPSEK